MRFKLYSHLTILLVYLATITHLIINRYCLPNAVPINVQIAHYVHQSSSELNSRLLLDLSYVN